ncbi:GNAT family N-acetyltransferase [Oerskovia jenensis]|uniref:GNAT family N-acetyltransferase n=1 Tax=Oerskovia jenensis TaxID=162169 RepID=UPI0036D75F43
MIRPATPSDAEAIAELIAEGWEEDLEYTRDLVMEEPGSWTVAVRSDRVVGVLHDAWFGAWHILAGFPDRDADDRAAKSVSYLVVTVPYRNRGVGSELLDTWIRALPSTIEYVFTSPEPGPDEAARRRFFARHGFRLIGTGPSMRDTDPWIMGRSVRE